MGVTKRSALIGCLAVCAFLPASADIWDYAVKGTYNVDGQIVSGKRIRLDLYYATYGLDATQVITPMGITFVKTEDNEVYMNTKFVGDLYGKEPGDLVKGTIDESGTSIDFDVWQFIYYWWTGGNTYDITYYTRFSPMYLKTNGGASQVSMSDRRYIRFSIGEDSISFLPEANAVNGEKVYLGIVNNYSSDIKGDYSSSSSQVVFTRFECLRQDVSADDVQNDNTLIFKDGVVLTSDDTNITVLDASGINVVSLYGNRLDISNLKPGIYVVHTPGKIIKIKL